jgi:hypothetical protein
MPTIDELKRMARRHNRNTHIGVAQSKASLTRELDTKNASMSPPDTGEAIPHRRRQRGSAVNKKHAHAPKPPPAPKPSAGPPAHSHNTRSKTKQQHQHQQKKGKKKGKKGKKKR